MGLWGFFDAAWKAQRPFKPLYFVHLDVFSLPESSTYLQYMHIVNFSVIRILDETSEQGVPVSPVSIPLPTETQCMSISAGPEGLIIPHPCGIHLLLRLSIV